MSTFLRVILEKRWIGSRGILTVIVCWFLRLVLFFCVTLAMYAHVFSIYYKYMGGVDLADILLSTTNFLGGAKWWLGGANETLLYPFSHYKYLPRAPVHIEAVASRPTETSTHREPTNARKSINK